MEQERVLALYDAYADGVYRVALGYLRSAHDAEDAVQAVFCRLLEKELTIWPGRERAFLTKLTINHCKNQLAAAKRQSASRRRRWTSCVCRRNRRTARCFAR